MPADWGAARIDHDDDSSRERRAAAMAVEFFYAFGRHDVDAIIRLCTDDVVEELPGVGPVEGIDNERAFLEELFGAFPDLSVEVTRVTATPDAVVVEWIRRGTFSGGPFMGLPASDKAFESRAAGVFEFDEDRISRMTVYSDTGQFFRDIGVLPAEGSVAARVALALFRIRVRVGRISRALTPRRNQHT
jgi:steroid delta-isomerase-like uncharacterized protein